MKNTMNTEKTMEQKIYTVLIGLGICALGAVTLFYGINNRDSKNLAEQDVQFGQDNPVSGPVARTEVKEKETEEERTSETVDTTEAPKTEEREKKTGYTGEDKLTWPVTGNVIIPYSMDTTVYFETLDQYQCNPALYIKADKGTEVKAAWEGTVTDIVKSDRYGEMVMVDMGNGYRISYGQLSDISCKKGDYIKEGTVLGKIGEPTDYFLLEGSHLYMKMTLNEKEVNPTEYLDS